MEELLESDTWEEFLKTKGGVLALDKILALRSDLKDRIGSLEQERMMRE